MSEFDIILSYSFDRFEAIRQMKSAQLDDAVEKEKSQRYFPVDEAGINYGALSSNLKDCGPEKYYLTTAIAYTNGYPHIGHAYEFLTADVLVRYHRVLGFDTYFLTGSDEHGQKVANSAEKAGRSPKEHCDIFVNAFKSLNQRLVVTNSDYLRTTDPAHELTSQLLWKRCARNGDIYLDCYEGWYNEREEAFIPDAEAEANNFIDPGNGLPLKRVKEESYFFRMSNYLNALLDHIDKCPEFIQPEQYRNNIIIRLKKEGLKDLSISRTSFTWGIPVPEGFDSKHVMYVWFDALSNYLSGVHALDIDINQTEHQLSSYWPADIHIIGKDIIWFHCVIWPCMLMSAQLPLPKQVFAHGFVNASDGRKMSKSYNNTIEPHEVLDKYSIDSLRYYTCASTTYGADCNFSESTLVTMHNSELADIFGNLVNRALNLCAKYCNGMIPDTKHDPAFTQPFDLNDLIQGTIADAAAANICSALFRAMEAVRATNRFLTEAEPWKMKGADESRRQPVVRTTLEAIYAFTHVLAPVIPIACKSVFDNLHTPPRSLRTLNLDFYNLSAGTKVDVGEILFHKIDIDGKMEANSGKQSVNKGEKATKQVAKANSETTVQKKDDKKKSNDTAIVEDPNQPLISKIDLRVGKITKVWNHETADRLYCEEIDVGEATVRPIASGLRQYYTLEEMQNRLVIVVCNLKEAKMQGFVSTGMVLAAKAKDKVELVSPPANARVGDRVLTSSVLQQIHSNPAWIPWIPNKVKKNKVWETLAEGLRSNAEGIACLQNEPLCTEGGNCYVISVVNAPIS